MIHVEPRDTVCVRATVVDVFPTDLAVEFGSASLMRTTLLVPRSSIVPVVEGETAGEVARLLVRQAERLLEMALRLQAEVAEVAEALVTAGPGGPADQKGSR